MSKKNKLTDLNDHLFAQLERLGDEDLLDTPEKLEREMHRARAMSGVAKDIIATQGLQLEAQKVALEWDIPTTQLPKQLGVDK